MAGDKTQWLPATQAALKKATGAGTRLVVLIDGAGVCYIGLPQSLGPSYIELLNGDKVLTVWYTQRRYRFAMLDKPGELQFTVRDAELPIV